MRMMGEEEKPLREENGRVSPRNGKEGGTLGEIFASK